MSPGLANSRKQAIGGKSKGAPKEVVGKIGVTPKVVSLKPSVSVKVESEKKNQWEICIMILIAKNWLMLLWGQARQVQNLQGTLSGMAGRGAQDGVYS